MKKYPSKKPDFENKKLKIWKEKPSKNQKAILEVNDKERIFEIRVYPIKLGFNKVEVKIMSKQDLKSGKIEAFVLEVQKDKKIILAHSLFDDENQYAKAVKSLELELVVSFGVQPKEVMITTGKELETIISKVAKQNAKEKKKIKPKYLACIWCGRLMPKSRPFARYCSDKCKREALGQKVKK